MNKEYEALSFFHLNTKDRSNEKSVVLKCKLCSGSIKGFLTRQTNWQNHLDRKHKSKWNDYKKKSSFHLSSYFNIHKTKSKKSATCLHCKDFKTEINSANSWFCIDHLKKSHKELFLKYKEKMLEELKTINLLNTNSILNASMTAANSQKKMLRL